MNRLSIDGHVAADDVGDDVKICGSCKWASLFQTLFFMTASVLRNDETTHSVVANLTFFAPFFFFSLQIFLFWRRNVMYMFY